MMLSCKFHCLLCIFLSGLLGKKPIYRAVAKSIHEKYGGTATHLYSTSVDEPFDGNTVSRSQVEVFSLKGDSRAQYCYAWAYPTWQDDIFIVLQIPPVISPGTAVRAAVRGKSK